MILGVDHLVFATPDPDAAEQKLKELGFVHGDAGRHHDLGTANRNYAFAGGGFVEILFEAELGAAPANWFEEPDRLTAACFTTTDLDGDAARWELDLPESRDSPLAGREPGAWAHTLSKTMTDGSRQTLRSAGPLPRTSIPYFFLGLGSAPRFAHLDASPRLLELLVCVEEPDRWQGRVKDLFGFPELDGSLSTGGVILRFVHSRRPHLAACFEIPDGDDGSLFVLGGRVEHLP